MFDDGDDGKKGDTKKGHAKKKRRSTFDGKDDRISIVPQSAYRSGIIPAEKGHEYCGYGMCKRGIALLGIKNSILNLNP